MIKLYSFGPAFGLPDPSPFVVKVDLYLRINNIEFESIPNVDNLREAPKKKLPFIEDQGDIVADSTFIIDHVNDKYDVSLDDWLTSEQHAQAYLLGKSLDENLYWCLVYSRWIDDDTWPMVRANFFDDLAFPLNKLIPLFARRSTRRQIVGHGLGNHTQDEVLSIAKKSFDSLSVMLGDKKFFFGDKICSFDVTAFALLSGFVLSTLDTPMNRMANGYGNLTVFCEHMFTEYYSSQS